jgi:hypothetical protein
MQLWGCSTWNILREPARCGFVIPRDEDIFFGRRNRPLFHVEHHVARHRYRKPEGWGW